MTLTFKIGSTAGPFDTIEIHFRDGRVSTFPLRTVKDLHYSPAPARLDLVMVNGSEFHLSDFTDITITEL